ncbi:DUF5689 domain-containing protein [Aestuariivivens sediminicola]|uniref:DUF5689 domain-containing protein n=1 Tax=Aestuariivivens sediminicola TaxID=2913560 RepID=UPI001F55FBE6|nr:DUF5689 domain-containing protein [Aestuariivivens sediminicola]
MDFVLAMNNRKHKRITSYFILIFMCWSCLQDDRFAAPDISIQNPNIPMEQLTSFKAVKSLYEQAVNDGQANVLIEDDIYIEGYVISTDRAGNFYKELIIQNKTDDGNPDSDPRLGFRIEINDTSLSDIYQFGQRVFVKLKGLTVGKVNGVLVIGKGEGVKVKQIHASEYRDIVIRTNDVVDVLPVTVSLDTLSETYENTLIEMHNLQLNRFELGATFAGESYDDYDGYRLLESCDSGIQMVMQTSTFSDFKALMVPQGKGSITGIYSRDYRDQFNVLIPNSSADIHFDSSERCDPLEFGCGTAAAPGTVNLFFEDFESQKNNNPISGNGWTNYAEEGSESWEAWTSSSANASLGRSARFQSASSGDVSNIGWLITPPINLNKHPGTTLRFKTSNSQADSSYMEVFYATNWDGNEGSVASADWFILGDAYVVKDSDSFVEWLPSGTVDLSCISGTIHIAFKYTGSGRDGFDGVYELDDVSIDYVE